MFRLLPPDRRALEALVIAIEADVSRLSAYRENAEAYFRAKHLPQHPQCPAEARARLTAELERLAPLVSRWPTVSLLVQSHMLPHSVACLRTDALAGLRVALADLEELHRCAVEALYEMPADPAPPHREGEQAGPAGAGFPLPPLPTITDLGRLAYRHAFDVDPSPRAPREPLALWGDEQEQADAPSGTPPPEAENRKVKVNREGKPPTVTLEDGVTYSVSPEGAAVVDILVRESPKYVTYSKMRESDNLLTHQVAAKIGRDIIDRLPEQIRVRIKREPGKGCTWLAGLSDPHSVL